MGAGLSARGWDGAWEGGMRAMLLDAMWDVPECVLCTLCVPWTCACVRGLACGSEILLLPIGGTKQWGMRPTRNCVRTVRCDSGAGEMRRRRRRAWTEFKICRFALGPKNVHQPWALAP